MAVSSTPMDLTRAAHVGISVADLDVSNSVPFGVSQGLPVAKLRYATCASGSTTSVRCTGA
ncbi:hypothetical protein STRCI_000952 [Streptomyces cinnabarinus]|uniref:Uncharacterized protein n=1 Tax=Streptomyces cinnabarinus TaxID=67287 RepID=A0ABY7K7V0_9ACTN|nr:hypothetical protein [Streptomyces cinnabarinus]WAZ19870.1 hypothetical protein STRCI_000952 [Streptomyces cinnabarinus]